MQYHILKTIISTSLSQCTCQNCGHSLDESHLSIKELSEHMVDFDLECPQCHSHTLIHAEVGSPKQAGFIPGNQSKSNTTPLIQNNTHALKEKDIIDVENTITKGVSVEDLLK